MSIKLLIADDEDTIRNGIAKYIQLHTDRFDKVYLAANGREALDIILRDRPDILFLDVQMPLLTGIEVMQEAKRADALPYTMILSAYDEFKYCQQANELFGADKQLTIESTEEKNYLVELAREYVEEHYYENLMLADVAQKVGISSGYLSTLFQRQLSKGFVDYLNEVRIEHACSYLLQNYLKTYEIAYKVGFRDEKYFSRVFKKVKGQSPSEYRKQNQ